MEQEASLTEPLAPHDLHKVIKTHDLHKVTKKRVTKKRRDSRAPIDQPVEFCQSGNVGFYHLHSLWIVTWFGILTSCRFDYETSSWNLGVGAAAGASAEGGDTSGGRGSGGAASSNSVADPTGGSGGEVIAGGGGTGSANSNGGTSSAGGRGGTGGGSGGEVIASGGAAGEGGTGGEATAGGGTAGGGTTGGASGSGGEPSTSYCNQLTQLETTPTIDGVLEPTLSLQPLVPEGFQYATGNGPEYQSIPDGVSAEFAVAWLTDGLYFFVDITDPDRQPPEQDQSAYHGDGIELYVDHDASFAPAGFYDDPGTRQFIIAAPATNTTDSSRAETYLTFGSIGDFMGSWISTPRQGGFVVEAYIRAADLGLQTWTLSEGAPVAFDLSHNVSYPDGTIGEDGHRLGQYFLKIADSPTGELSDYPYNNSGVFCVPGLESSL